MPETAENVATDYGIEREAQDRMALASQLQGGGGAEGRLLRRRDHAGDHRRRRRATPLVVSKDEHPRETSLEALAKLKGVVQARRHGDRRQRQRRQRRRLRAAAGRRGHAPRKHGLTPRARVVGMATAGVRAARHGHRPGAGHAEGAGADRPDAGADRRDRAERSLRRAGPGRAAHCWACRTTTRASTPTAAPSRWATRWAPRGARLATTAVNQLHATGGRYALCTMCIGVGQGIAVILERV